MARPPKNIAASVRAKLANISGVTGDDFNLLLVRFAAERLLYRLAESKHAKSFVLKGAMLFTAWGGPRHRATRDVDLLGYGDATPNRLIRLFREVCVIDVTDDGIRFQEATVEAEEIRGVDEYGGIRVTLRAKLGDAVVPVQIDIGFGDVLTPPAVSIEFPTLLEMPAPKLRAYPKETVIAEKTEAIVKLGMINSRFKDYFDIRQLILTQPFDGKLLLKAVRATFARRGTAIPELLPVGLTDEFATDAEKQKQWQAFCNKSRIVETGVTLVQVVEQVRQFIAPILAAARTDAKFHATWSIQGPWLE